jgi:hypothetical protein
MGFVCSVFGSTRVGVLGINSWGFDYGSSTVWLSLFMEIIF